jgi:hypothetical protein
MAICVAFAGARSEIITNANLAGQVKRPMVTSKRRQGGDFDEALDGGGLDSGGRRDKPRSG